MLTCWNTDDLKVGTCRATRQGTPSRYCSIQTCRTPLSHCAGAARACCQNGVSGFASNSGRVRGLDKLTCKAYGIYKALFLLRISQRRSLPKPKLFPLLLCSSHRRTCSGIASLPFIEHRTFYFACKRPPEMCFCTLNLWTRFFKCFCSLLWHLFLLRMLKFGWGGAEAGTVRSQLLAQPAVAASGIVLSDPTCSQIITRPTYWGSCTAILCVPFPKLYTSLCQLKKC